MCMRTFYFIMLLASVVNKGYAQGEVIADFIKNNPDKSSIYWVQNGEMVADINSDRKMPLASTVKIIVAIEYAHQVAAGNISPLTMVDTSELNQYYIPNTDGGAQPAWIKDMAKNQRIKSGQVNLEEVAKGMINYSSNANTEYLLDLLGLENVNSRLEKLELKKHDNLYYFISALMLFKDNKLEELQKMPIQEYITQANAWHLKMKANGDLSKQLKDIPINKQKVWSNRLPASTTRDYADIMHKINSRTYFEPEVQRNIDLVMEGLLTNPVNRQWMEHAGTKGGSTVWVLTKALYATLKNDETTEIAYFFNDLTLEEQMTLQKNLNNFELAILANKESSRDKLIEILSK